MYILHNYVYIHCVHMRTYIKLYSILASRLTGFAFYWMDVVHYSVLGPLDLIGLPLLLVCRRVMFSAHSYLHFTHYLYCNRAVLGFSCFESAVHALMIFKLICIIRHLMLWLQYTHNAAHHGGAWQLDVVQSSAPQRFNMQFTWLGNGHQRHAIDP